MASWLQRLSGFFFENRVQFRQEVLGRYKCSLIPRLRREPGNEARYTCLDTLYRSQWWVLFGICTVESSQLDWSQWFIVFDLHICCLPCVGHFWNGHCFDQAFDQWKWPMKMTCQLGGVIGTPLIHNLQWYSLCCCLCHASVSNSILCQHYLYTLWAQHTVLAGSIGGLWIWWFGPKLTVKNKFGGGASSPFIQVHCCLSLEVLEQSHEFANLQEIKLAAC